MDPGLGSASAPSGPEMKAWYPSLNQAMRLSGAHSGEYAPVACVVSAASPVPSIPIRQIRYSPPRFVRGAKPDAPFELGSPVALKVPADVPYLRDLTPDGKRSLAVRELPSAPDRLAIVQNFFEELRAKVPVK